jgi:hypothetical protein
MTTMTLMTVNCRGSLTKGGAAEYPVLRPLIHPIFVWQAQE